MKYSEGRLFVFRVSCNIRGKKKRAKVYMFNKQFLVYLFSSNNSANKMFHNVYAGAQHSMQEYMYAQQNYPRQMVQTAGYLQYAGEGQIKDDPNSATETDGYYQNSGYPTSTDPSRAHFTHLPHYPYGAAYNLPENTNSFSPQQHMPASSQHAQLYDQFRVSPSPTQDGHFQFPVKGHNFQDNMYWPQNMKTEPDQDLEDELPAKRVRYDADDSCRDSDSS